MTSGSKDTGFVLGTIPGGVSFPQRTVRPPWCVWSHSLLAHLLTCQPKLRAEVDASRIQDRRPVVLKKVSPQEGPHELRIGQQFSSPEHSSKPDNHCAPLLGVIELSGRFGPQKLMVFPLLYPYNRPRIRTFGEFVAFFTQICEARPSLHNIFMHHPDILRTGYPIHASTKRCPPV
jgi:hypothetical protein